MYYLIFAHQNAYLFNHKYMKANKQYNIIINSIFSAHQRCLLSASKLRGRGATWGSSVVSAAVKPGTTLEPGTSSPSLLLLLLLLLLLGGQCVRLSGRTPTAPSPSRPTTYTQHHQQ
jgi:hypothetical protein